MRDRESPARLTRTSERRTLTDLKVRSQHSGIVRPGQSCKTPIILFHETIPAYLSFLAARCGLCARQCECAGRTLVPQASSVVSSTYRERFAKDLTGTFDKIKSIGITDIEFSNLFGKTTSELHAPSDQGHQSKRLAQLSNIAQCSGRPVKFDPTDGHILDDPEAMKLWTRNYQPRWEPTV